ncbi:Tethering factor for nuclear proteasome sts1 [Saxophila tyrrhenica]|uniref:Tethering factor for nuclear proteasome STS1 n=1 Tax=Saxophila tyrrhenica TaxID=1690608 RepID=A0AAV9PCQ6_9PEZI|nr:Tethering factor for nuclear proteasome sts1 [Saxophila tyrrhenica]
MNSVIHNNPLAAPHLLVNNFSPRSADSFSPPQSMSGRKRKASEEPDNDRMSTSPSASPSVPNRALPSSSTHRSIKRTRTGNAVGRPLPLPRLLQTLSGDELRQLLQNICDQHPELQRELITKAPRPSIESTLSVLSTYEDDFRKAFPLGNRPTSDYTYNRVRQHLSALIEALKDFTPHFLPPQETQTALSFNYLDGVTNMIHRLPDWDTFQHQRHKNDAYDELSKAWALVIREAAKRAGGFHLQLGGWDQKLLEHNQRSGGKLEEAVGELNTGMGFMQTGQASMPGVSDERMSIRQQLFSGSYGQQLGVGPGRF